jgi:Flagellar transcriptional activator (FlhC)
VIAQEISVWNTAKEMIRIGLRPPIVHVATGLCRNRLRNFYRVVHGRPAVQGRVSEFAYNRLKTKSQVVEAMMYCQLYYDLSGDRAFRVIDNNLFVEAYWKYKATSPDGLDGTTAWYITRDLRERQLEIRRCRACGREYLFDPRSDLMSRCPLCAG